MKSITFTIFTTILLLISAAQAEAQPSYSTKVAFILRDDNNEKINLEQFKAEYKIAGVFGRVIPNEELVHYLCYDDSTGYFILYLTTIGPRFSFALYQKDSCMAIYLPFIRQRSSDKYYAIDIQFTSGTYLIDYNLMNKEKIYIDNNKKPYHEIKHINWDRQHKKFLNSNYKEDKTYQQKPK